MANFEILFWHLPSETEVNHLLKTSLEHQYYTNLLKIFKYSVSVFLEIKVPVFRCYEGGNISKS
jgi:hypothetical protein